MTRRQSLACWGLSYSNMRLSTSPPVPFSFSQWGGRACAFLCLIRLWIKQSIYPRYRCIKVFIPWHLHIHVEPIRFSPRNDTFLCCKWKAVSRSSIIYCSAFDSFAIIQATNKCSFDWHSSCHFPVVTPATVSETTSTPTEPNHDAFFICMSYYTGARLTLMSFSSLPRVRISTWDMSTVSHKSLMMIMGLGPYQHKCTQPIRYTFK